MTTPTLQAKTARAVVALRELAIEVCAARPDGVELLATLQAGYVRIVVDERLGVLELVRMRDDEPEWLETISIDPKEPVFGALASLMLGARTVTH
jgi:hypothetical protein